MNIFDKAYMKYWQQSVEKSVDGSIIAGPAVCAEYVKLLNLQEGQTALDLGCSFGRMFPVLREKTSQVYGVDLDENVVAEAAQKPYIKVSVGQAEAVPFADQFFDAVLAWAVFDVVEQNQGFAEVNRILKPAGLFLVTGKNASYHRDDRLGFVAERNANLKSFPNRFTDVKLLLEKIGHWGFEVRHQYFFARRGDCGINKPSLEAEVTSDKKSYEYLLVLQKNKNIETGVKPSFNLARPISKTAEELAHQAGFTDVAEFFKDSFQKDT